MKPLAQLAEATPSDSVRRGLDGLAGTYVGVWQSKQGGAGALALTVVVENGVLAANAAITGSPPGYRGDALTASSLKNMGDGVWLVEFTGAHSKLIAAGILVRELRGLRTEIARVSILHSHPFSDDSHSKKTV